MDVLKEQYKEHERRISILEKRMDDSEKRVYEHTTNLATIILKLENIAKSLEKITNNWKEAVNRSNARQQEEHEMINNKITNLEKNVEALNTKLESNTKSLENTIDERTILKDNKSYDSIKSDIVKLIVSTVLGFILGMVLK